MKKLSYIISLCIFAYDVQAVDLFQTYQAALSYNADYLKAIATNQAGQEQQNLARSTLLPQIGVTAGLTENYFNQNGITAYYHQPTYGAQFTQVIIDYGKFSSYAKGKFATQLADLQLINARQQLMVSVAQAYFDVLYSEDRLLATQMTKSALEKQMKQADAAFKVGTVTIADVNDAKSGYDAAVAQEIQDTNDLISKKNTFRNLTGVDPEQIQPIQDSINLVLPSPENDSAWSKIAESGNMNIKIASKQADMAKEDISVSRSGHYPTLNFKAQYQYQDTSTIDAGNITPAAAANLTYPGGPLSTYGVGAAMLQLSIPISSGGAVNSQTRQAMDNYSASQQQLVSVERKTNQDVRNAFWQVQNGVSIVKAQKAALLSAKTKLDSDTLGYQVGVRNSVDLVASQKNYYDTFQTYQQSRYQYLMAEVTLQYLGGSINEEFLQKLNADIKK